MINKENLFKQGSIKAFFFNNYQSVCLFGDRLFWHSVCALRRSAVQAGSFHRISDHDRDGISPGPFGRHLFFSRKHKPFSGFRDRCDSIWGNRDIYKRIVTYRGGH